jgi:hypothetical protein
MSSTARHRGLETGASFAFALLERAAVHEGRDAHQADADQASPENSNSARGDRV